MGSAVGPCYSIATPWVGESPVREPDVEAAVTELTTRGEQFERYDDVAHDDRNPTAHPSRPPATHNLLTDRPDVAVTVAT